MIGLAGVLIALVSAPIPASAAAQDSGFVREIGIQSRDLILERMDLLICGDEPCQAASDAEKAAPPVTDDEAAAIARTALISAMAEHCGLDWEGQSFLPMMAGWRSVPGIDNRKLALVGATHGVVQGQALTAVRQGGACSEQMRAATQSRLNGNGN